MDLSVCMTVFAAWLGFTSFMSMSLSHGHLIEQDKIEQNKTREDKTRQNRTLFKDVKMTAAAISAISGLRFKYWNAYFSFVLLSPVRI